MYERCLIELRYIFVVPGVEEREDRAKAICEKMLSEKFSNVNK